MINEDGGIQWKRVFAALREARFSIGIITVVMALIGFVATQAIRPQWEARGTLKVGKIGNLLSGEVSLIEAGTRLAARIQMLNFQERVSDRLKIAGSPSDLRRMRWDVKASVLPGDDLIQIVTKGTSEKEANEWLLGIINQIRAEHNELFDGATARLRAAQAKSGLELKEVSAEVARFRRVLESEENKKSDGTKYFLATAFLAQKTGEARALDTRLAQISDLIDRGYMSDLEGRAYVLDHPILYRRALLVLFSGLAGLCFGIFYVLAFRHRQT